MTTAQGIEAFVSAWAAMRPEPLTRRLECFLESWHAVRQAHHTPTPAANLPPRPSAAALARMLHLLGPALNHARASGAAFNLWQMAGLGRAELRNAGALAQLLAPGGNHGLGELPLAGLFDALQNAAPDCPRPERLMSATVGVEDRPLDSERDRVDLVVDHPELLLFLEIKIDAREGPGQLNRYLESAQKRASYTRRPAWRVAYLTRRPINAPGGVIALGWRDLATCLRSTLRGRLGGTDVRRPILQLLDHFAAF